MNQDPVDFSMLDPARDPERWERRVQNVLARAIRAHVARPWTIQNQLRSWARPAFALAAAAALLCWVGVVSGPGSGGLDPSRWQNATESSASALSRWAAGDEVPSVGRMLSVLGEAGR